MGYRFGPRAMWFKVEGFRVSGSRHLVLEALPSSRPFFGIGMIKVLHKIAGMKPSGYGEGIRLRPGCIGLR